MCSAIPKILCVAEYTDKRELAEMTGKLGTLLDTILPALFRVATQDLHGDCMCLVGSYIPCGDNPGFSTYVQVYDPISARCVSSALVLPFPSVGTCVANSASVELGGR